jgi:putative intracellular protease/amidase
MKILMVLTSRDRLGDTNHKTGFWLEEFAAPYYVFKDNGFKISLASPAGGKPPIDPNSEKPEAQTEATRRFYQDDEVQNLLADTQRLEWLNPEDFDALFYPGGHGPLWDLAEDINSISLIEAFYRRDKPIGCVCHAPAVLLRAKDSDGLPLVKGKRVTSFTNSEESLLQFAEVDPSSHIGITNSEESMSQMSRFLPFSVENMLGNLGADFHKIEDWASHVEIDGNLVTGQNPASAKAAAEALVRLLGK